MRRANEKLDIEASILTAIITGLLTAFGAGDLVPYIGPAVQVLLAIVAFGTAFYSLVSHRNKTNVMIAAGIK